MAYDYISIPDHMQESLDAYKQKGQRPGSFLYKVLLNDLVGAAGQADDINKHCLFAYAQWLFNDLPTAAWRTEENIEAWIAAGGMEGQGVAIPKGEN